MGNLTSPCINICKLNENKVCIGCYRTIDEIANWTKYTNEEKLAIINKVENQKWQRLKQEL